MTILHPNAAELYRQKVADLHDALRRGDAASREAVAMIRQLVQRITVRPQPDRMALEIEGDLAGLLHREQGRNSSTTSMVAGARNHLDLQLKGLLSAALISERV